MNYKIIGNLEEIQEIIESYAEVKKIIWDELPFDMILDVEIEAPLPEKKKKYRGWLIFDSVSDITIDMKWKQDEIRYKSGFTIHELNRDEESKDNFGSYSYEIDPLFPIGKFSFYAHNLRLVISTKSIIINEDYISLSFEERNSLISDKELLECYKKSIEK